MSSNIDKKTNNQLKKLKSEIKFLRSIINELPENIYLKSINGTYLLLNQSARDSLKNKHKIYCDLIGKNDFDVFPKESAEVYRKNDIKVIKNKIELSEEEEILTPNGEKLIQLSSKKPLLDDGGHVIGLLGITVDITEKKKLEQIAIKEKEKAESANKAKTAFIRNMEHDIRTPLVGIYSLAKALSKRENHIDMKEYLDDFSNCADKLLKYCDEILEFSKIEKDIYPVNRDMVDFRAVCYGVYKIELPAIKSKNLKLNLSFDDKLPSKIYIDRYRLTSILINLISNAIKFTEKGGVSLCANLVKNDKKEKLLRLIISDTGLGIEKSKQQDIFDEFVRLSPSYKGIYKGQGLGLSIVKRFVNDLGGYIKVDSTLGEGTTFTIDFPIKSQ